MASKLATILADFTTSLATELVVGGTTATLSSAVDDDGVALPSGRYFLTLDNSNTSKEHISCDLVGTALTNIKSVSRQGVETVGVVRKHRIGSTVTLTDFGNIKFMNDILKGTTPLDASTPLGYDGAPGSLTGNQLATVTYVLGVVNGGAVTFDQQIISGQTSGEALAINDIVYFKEADAKWYKADADLTATFDQLQIGINKTTSAGNTTTQVTISGPVSGFTGLTAGAKYYLSNTAGAITTTPGTNSVFIGWALTSTTLLFNPILKTLPTQKEKDALAGSQGTPSTTNKYITQDNTTVAGTDQSQTTQNASIETGEANATTRKNKIAQSFIPGKTKIRGVALWKATNTGTFTGTVTVSIQADTSGSPSGTALVTKTLTNVEYLALATGAFDVMYSSEISMTTGSTYWIVVETSTSDTSNRPNIGTNSAGLYSSGSVKSWNTTDGWTAVPTVDLYFKTYEGTNNQVVTTDGTGTIHTNLLKNPSYQRIFLGVDLDNGTQSNFVQVLGYTQNNDGSVFYVMVRAVYFSGGSDTYSTYINRYEIDKKTGLYSLTHSTTFGGNLNISTMFVNGSYLHVIQDYGAVVNNRYNADDLTNMTSCSGISTIGNLSLYGFFDGTYYYHLRSGSATANRYTLSGTTFSSAGTVTFQDFGHFSYTNYINGSLYVFTTPAYSATNGPIQNATMKVFDVAGNLLKTVNIPVSSGELKKWSLFYGGSVPYYSIFLLGHLQTKFSDIRYILKTENVFSSYGTYGETEINLIMGLTSNF